MTASRRDFLKYLVTGIGGLAVGTALGWAMTPSQVREVVRTVTETKTTTTTATAIQGAPAAPRLNRDTIKIGVLGIRSGTWATYGTLIEQGARMAAEEINSAGGVLGAKIALEFRDEAADVVKQARDLVESWGADFLVGVDSSGNVMKLGPVMPDLNRMLIVVHAATHRLTEELVYGKRIRNIFRISVPVYQDGILAAYIAKDLPIKKWAGIEPDYEYGRVSWDLFTQTLKALRPDVEFVGVQWARAGTTDFSPFISAVMSTDAEGLHTVEWAVEAITLHKQARELGLYRKLKAVINPMGYSMDVAYGLGSDYPVAELGTWVSGRYVWLYPPTSANRQFVENFRKRWGRYPAYSSETTYSALYLIKMAVEKTGSLDLDSLIKTIEGVVMMTPAGVRWIRPEDHQAVYEVPYGKIAHRGAEVPLLDDLRAVPAWLYYRSPPFA